MRRVVFLVALCLVTTGCVGVLSGDGLRFESSPIRIDDGTLSETGYERAANRTISVNRTFELQGQERRAHLTNHVRTYRKPYRDAPLEYTVGLTTPAASAFGQSVNPLVGVGDRQLVEIALEEVARVNNLTHVGNRSITVLGTETTVEKYAARAEQNGTSSRVSVHVTHVTHESDVVLLVGMYPTTMDDGEADVVRLFRGVEHSTEDE